jgi:methyl-accepting chemotaxis protein
MTALVVTVTLILGISSSLALYQHSNATIDQIIQIDGNANAKVLDNYLRDIKEDIQAIVITGTLTSTTISDSDRQRTLEDILTGRPDIRSIYLVNHEGIAIADADVEDIGADYSRESFFIQGIQSDDYFIDPPKYDKWTHNVTMTITYHLQDENGFDGLVCADINYDAIAALIDRNDLGESGHSFVLDNLGNYLAHAEEAYVLENRNYFVRYEDEPNRVALFKGLLKKPDVLSSFTDADGEEWRVYSHTLPETGWMYFSVAKTEEFMDGFYKQLFNSLLTCAVCLFLAVVLALILSHHIANPISLMTERMKKFAAGDVHSPMPKITSTNEIGILYESMKSSMNSQSAYISDISERLSHIATGDLRYTSSLNYIGDYQAMQLSLEQIQQSMNQILSSIKYSSITVHDTASVIAARGKELSDHSVTHAQTIDQIDNTFKEIRLRLRDTASNTAATLQKTSEARQALDHTRVDMEKMLDAMHKITEATSSIRNIIKVIDEIAFQTNLLSLNAAVEAARAGQHGKGFAVVADEVRNLAGKSAESAKQTESLINNTLDTVVKGEMIAEESWSQIVNMQQIIIEVDALVDGIEKMATEQAAAADEIYEGISRINAITQHDSAMSEESASSSTQLSEMAGELNRQIAYFQVFENNEEMDHHE